MNTSRRTGRFGIVSHNVMTDPELSVQAKCLYALLCCYANKERKCFPKKTTLADQLNVSMDSVKRYLRELRTKNYIKRDGLVITLL